MEIFVYDTNKSWIKKKHIISSKNQFDNLKQIKNIKDKVGEIYVDKEPRVFKDRTPGGKFIRSTQYEFFYFKKPKEKNKHKLIERTYHERIGYFYSQKREAKKLGFKFISQYPMLWEQQEIVLKHRLSKVL